MSLATTPTPVSLPPSVATTGKLSPITQFLNVPSIPVSKKNSSASARVLTSAQAIAMMEQKIKKKEEEKQAKEARKKEREEKKREREEVARKKVLERQQKAEERRLKAAEKEEALKKKAKEREEKAAEKRRRLIEKESERKRKESSRQRSTRQNKENLPTSSAPSTSCDMTREQNECSVCMGNYEDDFMDGELQNEWICCTNCSRWMHLDCITVEGNSYVCVLCNVAIN